MKKIIDIIPLKKAQKIGSDESFNKKRSFRFNLKALLILVLSLILTGTAVIIGLSFCSKLTINLVMVQESISLQEQVRVDTSQELLELEEKNIPGRIFEIEKEKWSTFQATGRDFEEGKAQGTIIVYNTQSPARAITLRSQTRFLSSEGGKIFRAPERIYLAPAQMKGGKLVASAKEVKVAAQEAGEDYNIGASQFSVPGLAGTDLYYTVWAESIEKMEGGFKKEVKKLTLDDLDIAKQELTKELAEIAKEALKSQMSETYTLKNEAIFEQDVELTCFKEAGERVAEFNCQGQIKARGLAVKLKDLKELAYHIFSSQIALTKVLVPQSLNFSFSSQGVVTEEEMTLVLNIQGKIYRTLSQEMILSQIQGKKVKVIERIIFDNYAQVKDVELKFWPFWVKKAPNDTKKINLGLTF